MLGDNRDGICGSEANANFAVEPTVVYKRFLKIACGYHHNAGVDEYGRVYTWGRSEFGQLGQGEVINSSIPTLIALPLRNIRVNEVCWGWQHTIAVTENGFLFSWGLNINGQLGLGDYADRDKPTLVNSLINTRVIKIAAGHSHSAMIDENNQLYTWGANPDARLCRRTSYYRLSHRPKNINKPALWQALVDRKIVDVALGADHSLFLGADGRVFASGNGERGQLGDPCHNWNTYPEPYVEHILFSTSFNRAVKIGAGDGFSVVLNEIGEVYSFGMGNYGRLGHYHGVSMSKPSMIDLVSDLSCF